MKQVRTSVVVLALCVYGATLANANAPSRVRELTCSDGTTFLGEQVRMGGGFPPRTWRNVVPGDDPVAFVFFEAAVTAPDGTVVDQFTWDHSQGVDANHPLVTCGFVIPEGPLAGYQADFVGYFLP